MFTHTHQCLLLTRELELGLRVQIIIIYHCITFSKVWLHIHRGQGVPVARSSECSGY